MAVKFISHVDQNAVGEWFIKLTDTLEDSSVICKNLEEYEKQIEELGGDYGGDIEVVWTRAPLLTPANYQDLQDKMAKLQEKYQEEIDKINRKEQEVQNTESGFNPNE